MIEVDGGQHNDDWQADHDLVRDKLLRRHGFTVLRFSAGEVRGNLGDVMDRIIWVLEDAPGVNEEGPIWEGPPQAPRSDHTSPP